MVVVSFVVQCRREFFPNIFFYIVMVQNLTQIRAVVSGRVQGVGYRYWTKDLANSLGLSGWVKNRPDGAVELVCAGATTAVDHFIAQLWKGPAYAKVAEVEISQERYSEACPNFTIKF